MAEFEGNGIRLLAEHLANVKLQAEEREYQLKREVKSLKNTVEELQELLEDSNVEIEKLKQEVKVLENQGSRKALLEERERWTRYIDSLKEENSMLEDRLSALEDKKNNEKLQENLREQIETKNQKKSILNQESISKAIQTPAFFGTQEFTKSLDESERISVTESRLVEKDKIIDALREKLDFELEMKWQRKKRQNGWQRTLIDSFKEVIAPLQSPTLDAITNKSIVYEGKEEENMQVV